jgi:hypothetical protein
VGACLSVIPQHPDLDQLVGIQCPVGLGDDRSSEPRIADHHDRVEMVRVSPQRAPIR